MLICGFSPKRRAKILSYAAYSKNRTTIRLDCSSNRGDFPPSPYPSIPVISSFRRHPPLAGDPKLRQRSQQPAFPVCRDHRLMANLDSLAFRIHPDDLHHTLYRSRTHRSWISLLPLQPKQRHPRLGQDSHDHGLYGPILSNSGRTHKSQTRYPIADPSRPHWRRECIVVALHRGPGARRPPPILPRTVLPHAFYPSDLMAIMFSSNLKIIRAPLRRPRSIRLSAISIHGRFGRWGSLSAGMELLPTRTQRLRGRCANTGS